MKTTNFNNWFEVRPFGLAPSRRAYHSTCIIGNNMYIFGGEDLREKIYDSMWMLPLGFIERNFNSRYANNEDVNEEDR
jgi:hypothetical protein